MAFDLDDGRGEANRLMFRTLADRMYEGLSCHRAGPDFHPYCSGPQEHFQGLQTFIIWPFQTLVIHPVESIYEPENAKIFVMDESLKRSKGG